MHLVHDDAHCPWADLDLCHGGESVSPRESSLDYGLWVEEDSNAHPRIWLGLNDNVKQAILPHADSHASQLFAALKSLYEPQGATAEYYARPKYENVKISDYDNLGDFMTELINAAHQFNKEISDVSSRIKDRDITLCIIYDLPASMHTLQTILLKTAPPSSNTQWDLQALRQRVMTAEDRAHAAGLRLGTKLDNIAEPKARTVQGSPHRGRRNDPTWLAHQSCWHCSKLGHLRQRCTSSQAERDAYKEQRNAEGSGGSANAVEPEVYLKAMVAEESDRHFSLHAEGNPSSPKPWLVDSGCSNHLSPNQSDFISYAPYDSPRKIRLGDSSVTPSLGEGTVSLPCIVNGKSVARHVQYVQYVPGLTYGLLSAGMLDDCGLLVTMGNGKCKIVHPDGMVIAEALRVTGKLYFLNMDTDRGSPTTSVVPAPPPTALAVTPSFGLIHKRLVHPGKEALQLMIWRELAIGLKGIPDDSKDFDCEACIHGKMTRGPFQSGHSTATVCLGRVHSDVCGPLEVPSLGKKCYFCVLVDDKTCYLWYYPCTLKPDFTSWFIGLDKLFLNHYGSHVKVL